MLKNTSRRNFLRGLSVISPLSYLSANAASINPKIIKTPDYFKALGVESFINAVGPYSSLGGAKMWPEVIEAMDYAITNKAKMNDLHNATGKRIAEMLGAEAAIVTSGATGAIIQGTAGCMTMGDSIKNERLPDTTGMKNEVIILKNQRYLYDRSIRAPGAILVEVNNLEELPNAINKKTAMLFYLLNRPDIENIDIETYIKIAKQYKIPIMCDAATTVPPIKRMAATIKYGFDLVCYSGGKGLRGPYSAGLLLGRKDLVEYAKQHGSPNHRAYGRSMKVAPEEYLGMMIAVETSLKYDEKAEFNRQRKTVKFMQAQLAIIPGITITINQPEFEASEPYIEIQWDKRYQITPKELKEKLRHGTPSIEIRALFLSQGNIHLTAVMLTMSEAQIVVQRINTILQKSLIES
jgi:L-seryl-tRNA(Ser) seleniumtransferase